ncbi:MAG: hypothetical protein M3044_18200 [Thermoproteota archaeon]|nr:hypothetical protein [Thermoproteota archaeon]
MKSALLIIPVIGVLLGAIPTTVFAQIDNQQQHTCPAGSQPISNGNCLTTARPDPNVTGSNLTCGEAMNNGSPRPFCASPDQVLLLCADGFVPDSKGYCGGGQRTTTSGTSQSTTQNNTGGVFPCGFTTFFPTTGSSCENSAWQEFAFVINNDNSNSLLNILNIHYNYHSGVWHNQVGVFIPWSTLCNAQQSQGILQQSCSDLIDASGSLTPAGKTAVGCITNGAIATVIASQFNIPLNTIRSLLGSLAGQSGCGGIVNMNQIQTSPDLQRLVQSAGQWLDSTAR